MAEHHRAAPHHQHLAGPRRRPHTLVAHIPEAPAASESPDENVVLRDQLRGLLAGLPAEQRDAVWLVDAAGVPVEDAAHELGVPVGDG